MAPAPRSEDEVFLDKLAQFHTQRGTPFDRDPKVGGRSINLLTLYNAVIQEGGYDVLSAERMRWRALIKEFGFGTNQEAAMTFQMKTTYYRYLTAFEIKNYWNEEPPPPEIVEHLTAKGGDVRKRTLENYSTNRESLPESDEETPRKGVEPEESGSTGRYPSRLRQDPKRTQLFQRPTISPQASPAPLTSLASSSDPRNSNFVLDKYTIKTMAMALRPVQTKSNSTFPPTRKIRPYEPQASLKYVSPALINGPNIYIRCLYGLRSGIPSEQDFALHHLVKVSYERGDKYRFEGFPGLAEALLEKGLEVSRLVHSISWTVSYEESAGLGDGNVLNGLYGTVGLLEKIQNAPLSTDSLETTDFVLTKNQLTQAALVIRNMSMLDDNAVFISRLSLLKDYLIITLNLGDGWAELRQYALDTAEQVTKYWSLDCTSPVYESLAKSLHTNDRGAIVAACRAMSRFGMEGPAATPLTNIPITTVHTLISFLLLEDDELMLVSLDILYQYLALPQNQALLWQEEIQVQTLISRLTTLLLHDAQKHEQRLRIGNEKPQKTITTIQNVPDDLFNQLLTYPEPERSTNWLKCCFEEIPNVDITQIAIWKAYQTRFMDKSPMVASDFIKNVSLTFTTAQAQVIPTPEPRFIIRGIRPKQVITDPAGKAFLQCHWKDCEHWARDNKNLWNHILIDHVKLERQENGQFKQAQGSYRCEWENCARTESNAVALGKHLRVHMYDEKVNRIQPPLFVEHVIHYTPMDEKGAVGIPYLSVLILKNWARFALRHEQTKSGETLMEKLFDGVKLELWKTFGMNKTLRHDLNHLLNIIEGSPPRRQMRSGTSE